MVCGVSMARSRRQAGSGNHSRRGAPLPSSCRSAYSTSTCSPDASTTLPGNQQSAKPGSIAHLHGALPCAHGSRSREHAVESSAYIPDACKVSFTSRFGSAHEASMALQGLPDLCRRVLGDSSLSDDARTSTSLPGWK